MLSMFTTLTRGLLVALSAIFLLSACQTTMVADDATATVEDLTPSAKKSFYKYLNNTKPGAFALAEDQSYAAWAYCTGMTCKCGGRQCTPQQMRDDTLTACTAEARTPCHLFASNRTIVWNGPPLKAK